MGTKSTQFQRLLQCLRRGNPQRPIWVSSGNWRYQLCLCTHWLFGFCSTYWCNQFKRRTTRRHIHSWLVRRNYDDTWNALPSDWYRNDGFEITQENMWIVNIPGLCLVSDKKIKSIKILIIQVLVSRGQIYLLSWLNWTEMKMKHLTWYRWLQIVYSKTITWLLALWLWSIQASFQSIHAVKNNACIWETDSLVTYWIQFMLLIICDYEMAVLSTKQKKYIFF